MRLERCATSPSAWHRGDPLALDTNSRKHKIWLQRNVPKWLHSWGVKSAMAMSIALAEDRNEN